MVTSVFSVLFKKKKVTFA